MERHIEHDSYYARRSRFLCRIYESAASGLVCDLRHQWHICARSRQGKFTAHVKTIDKRLRRGLKSIADWCKRYRHSPVDEQQRTLNAKLRSHYQYYGRRTNYASLRRFYREVCCIWRKWLNRRTRGNPLTWEKFYEVLRQNPLMTPEIMHT